MVVCITGGTSGIGQALVYEFAKQGARVVFTGQTLAHTQENEVELKRLNATYKCLCRL